MNIFFFKKQAKPKRFRAYGSQGILKLEKKIPSEIADPDCYCVQYIGCLARLPTHTSIYD